jgi:hypothetical protein
MMSLCCKSVLMMVLLLLPQGCTTASLHSLLASRAGSWGILLVRCLGIVLVIELLSTSTSLSQIMLKQCCLFLVLLLNLYLVLAISKYYQAITLRDIYLRCVGDSLVFTATFTRGISALRLLYSLVLLNASEHAAPELRGV